ncbi:MAG TPA: hypothetical protein VHS96_14080 [Bacteroidia bacterium]|nr:hypothetical protein [Bacteroidia bacterium]
MNAILLLGLLLINLQSMTEKKRDIGECIRFQISEFEKSGPSYAAIRTAHQVPDEPHFATQFGETDPLCPAELTFVKEADGERLGAIYFTLFGKTTLADLSKVFGEFKHLPPTPSKKWSVIAKYNSGSATQVYAIIASAGEKIDEKTKLRLLTIRIDYED